jgi:5-methylcytosine-specific restriction endonuclease McrA
VKAASADHVEIDHIVPFAEGGPTALDNLARLCRWHHYLKTHRGYGLTRIDDHWHWIPPPVQT